MKVNKDTLPLPLCRNPSQIHTELCLKAQRSHQEDIAAQIEGAMMLLPGLS